MMQPAKMKRDGDFEMGGSSKRCRLDDHPKRETTDARVHVERPAKFLACHLKILRALYQDEEDSSAAAIDRESAQTVGSGEPADKGEDAESPVDKSTWSLMEAFLQERLEILKGKQEASCWSGIHQESLQVGGSHDSITATTTPLQPSPSLRRLSVTPVHSHRLSHPLHHASMSQQSPTQQAALSNSFQIIARLLGKQSDTIRRQFEKQVDAYKPLLVSTNRRIERLKGQLKTLEQTIEEEDQRRMGDLMMMPNTVTVPCCGSDAKAKNLVGANDKEASVVQALETKIRLWELLAADVNSIV